MIFTDSLTESLFPATPCTECGDKYSGISNYDNTPISNIDVLPLVLQAEGPQPLPPAPQSGTDTPPAPPAPTAPQGGTAIPPAPAPGGGVVDWIKENPVTSAAIGLGIYLMLK